MRKVVDVLEYVTLGDITTSTQIFYDPDPRITVVEEDLDLMEGHFDIQEEEDDDRDTYRWPASYHDSSPPIDCRLLCCCNVMEKRRFCCCWFIEEGGRGGQKGEILRCKR